MEAAIAYQDSAYDKNQSFDKMHVTDHRRTYGQAADFAKARQMYRQLEDNHLVERTRQGEGEAFGELVRRYRSKVNSLALKITKNEIDAQEVVQDVFLNAFAKLESFKGTAAFSSWLYRVAANSALMLLRTRKRDAHDTLEQVFAHDTSAALSAPSDWSLRADRVFERKEIVAILDKEFENIPDRYRDILILREIDGLSNREIADVLFITVAAVKSRLHRARLCMRKQLGLYWNDEDVL